MKKIKLRCAYCKNYHEIKEKIPKGFAGWAYPEMDWSDFETEAEVPSLSEQYWSRSDRIPKVGELRIILVTSPFDEECGNVFRIEFMPALAHFNGYENTEELRDSAIVQCRLEKIILADEYCAWIEVKILRVILLSELPETFPPFLTDREIEGFDGISRYIDIDLMDDTWKIMSWSAQGDLGEYKTFYTDTNGIRHLVRMSCWNFCEDVTYYGNIVQRKPW